MNVTLRAIIALVAACNVAAACRFLLSYDKNEEYLSALCCPSVLPSLSVVPSSDTTISVVEEEREPAPEVAADAEADEHDERERGTTRGEVQGAAIYCVDISRVTEVSSGVLMGLSDDRRETMCK